jgi:hypothetical protein
MAVSAGAPAAMSSKAPKHATRVNERLSAFDELAVLGMSASFSYLRYCARISSVKKKYDLAIRFSR